MKNLWKKRQQALRLDLVWAESYSDIVGICILYGFEEHHAPLFWKSKLEGYYEYKL